MRLFLVLCLLLALPAAAARRRAARRHHRAPPGRHAHHGDAQRHRRPQRLATTYRFEYGTTTAYGLPSAGGDAGTGDAAGPVVGRRSRA